ncbi:MAG: hypothetical protein RJA42_297 [Bacteroidota bacterium]|jgi:hypothetical protein
MRSNLLAAITTATSTLTQFSVSQELPWDQNGQPLYRKNLKKIYVGPDRVEQTTLIALVGPGQDVYQNDRIAEVYLATDAKNPPSQLNQAITSILSARDLTGIVNFGTESDYVVEIQEDVLVYTFEFRLNVATT